MCRSSNMYKIIIWPLAFASVLQANVHFGSKNSAINLLNGSDLTIRTTQLYVEQGTVRKSSGATITGQPIQFFHGILATDDTEIPMTGQVTDGVYPIVLGGANSVFTPAPGFFADKILATRGAALLQGQPLFTAPDALTLQDFRTTLTIAINSALTKNIILGNGTLVLGSNLTLADDVIITTSGRIKFNGNRLLLGGGSTTWNSDLILDAAQDMVLNGRVTLTGTWTFTSDASLNGNGNVLDLTGGGTIWVRPGTTLSLTDITVRGLGIGRIILDSDSSQLRLSDVELNLSSNYNFTGGGIYAEGPTKVVTKDHILTFEQQASMTVDGISLLYSPLIFDADDNIRPIPANDPNQKFIAYLNDGVIKAEGSGGGDGELTRQNSNAIVYLDREVQTIDHGPMDIVITTTSHYLEFDVFLSSDHIMNIQSSTVIDGKGHTIHLAKASDGIIQMLDSLNVTFKNVIFRNYRDEIFLFGTDDTLIFGDGVRLEMAEALVMQMPWICQGTVAVNGHDNRLTVNPYGEMVVLPGGLLTLQNIDLDGVQDNNIRCCDRYATVKFSQAHLALSDVFTFTSGALIIDQDVSIDGAGAFNYESNTTSTINTTSSLRLTNIEFRYAPSVARKTLVSMLDQTSELYLNGCTLATTRTGLQLYKGTLRVDNVNTLDNEGGRNVSEAIIFGNGTALNDLHIVFHPGGTLTLVDGVVDYRNVDSN